MNEELRQQILAVLARIEATLDALYPTATIDASDATTTDDTVVINVHAFGTNA